MTRGRDLVLDDEPAMLENVDRLLASEGYDVVTLDHALRFRDVAAQCQPDVIVTDLRMPGANGMTILAAALADEPTRPVILMTAFGSIASAVAAIREGAFDFVTKPFSTDQLIVTVDRAMRWRGLTKENLELRAQVAERDTDGILGASAIMTGLLSQARRVAPGPANVLLTGESGTGKELFARFIHARSGRGNRPMVVVDCAALPEGLLERTVRATSAESPAPRARALGTQRQHRVLDEIAEMSLSLQAKLLRAGATTDPCLGDTRTIDWTCA